ncbi:MAG: MFS transporter [Thermoplasmata archaeon]|nr:MFS transporter [Thermoplasmata archaeon]
MEYKLYRYRWVVVVLLWLLIFAYGANWFAFSPMLTTFEKQFNIPNWMAHLLISLIGMFVIFFAWPAGSLIDKKGPKLSASIGGFFMALGFGLRPWLLNSFPTLLLSSILAGIGLAWILVAIAPQMLRWFPEKQASLPIGIVSSGLFIGFGTGSLAMPLLVAFTSMFNAFLVFAIIAVVSFIVFVVFAKDSPPTPPEKREKIEKISFSEGLKLAFTSKNAYLYPIIGFLIVGITLVISAFIHFLYPGEPGGFIGGILLYGCALGVFSSPFLAKKYGLKKIAVSSILGSFIFWLLIFIFYSYNMSWLFTLALAFLFGTCFQASWPLALYSQETEKGVTEANAGVAAGIYISLSNIGAATLPVLFGLTFANRQLTYAAILTSLLLCLILWMAVKRK